MFDPSLDQIALFTIGILISIIVVFIFEILDITFSLIALDIFILIVTLLSLVVYARNWFLSINKYHNE